MPTYTTDVTLTSPGAKTESLLSVEADIAIHVTDGDNVHVCFIREDRRSGGHLNTRRTVLLHARHYFDLNKKIWTSKKIHLRTGREMPIGKMESVGTRVVHAPVAMEIIGDKTLWMMR